MDALSLARDIDNRLSDLRAMIDTFADQPFHQAGKTLDRMDLTLRRTEALADELQIELKRSVRVGEPA